MRQAFWTFLCMFYEGRKRRMFLSLSKRECSPQLGKYSNKFAVEFKRYIEAEVFFDESTERFLPGERGKPAKKTYYFRKLSTLKEMFE